MNIRRIRLARQRGITLVELMVAMAVGLLLVAGLSLLYANASQSSTEMDKSVRQIENGRYAVDLLAEDLSMAGYFGEAIAEGMAATVSPCANAVAVQADLQAKSAAHPAVLPFPLQGLTPDETAALGCLPDHLAGTPAVVVRRLDVHSIPPASMEAQTLYVQSSFNSAETTATYVASANASDMVLQNLAGTAPNDVRRYVSRVYYVASCSDCPRDTIPTLKRAELRGTDVVVSPLAEGIERIGFDYGFDKDGDGTPDEWIGLSGAAGTTESAAAAADGWANVVAVRIHVLARTTEPTAAHVDNQTYAAGLNGTTTFTIGPFTDAYKRRDYTTTTRLNAVAGLRE